MFKKNEANVQNKGQEMTFHEIYNIIYITCTLKVVIMLAIILTEPVPAMFDVSGVITIKSSVRRSPVQLCSV